MKAFDKFMIGHLLFAFIVISCFVYWYEKPFDVIFLHLILVASLYFSTFLMVHHITRFFKLRYKIIATICFSILTTLLLSVYLFNATSNHFWNNNVSLDFIVTYFSDLAQLLDGGDTAKVYLILFFILVWGLIYVLYHKFVPYLHAMDEKFSYKKVKVYLFITCLTPLYFWLSFSPLDAGIWQGEPLTSLALKNSMISTLSPSKNSPATASSVFFREGSSNKVNYNLKNIVLVHADALRADHMNNYGYKRETTPYISQLVNDGAIAIDVGLSICSESVCGMLAALGSRYVDEIDEKTPLLNTYLKRAGYRTFFAGAGNFSWGKLDVALTHDIDYFARADLDKNVSLHDDRIIISALSKLKKYEGVPTFFFLRYLSSHPLGLHFSQYRKYTPAKKNLFSYIFPQFSDENLLLNSYDNNAYQLDALLKQSLQLLDKKGYLKNSLIVIYGDHGDALNEHGYYGHYRGLYQEEIRVPIIFVSSDVLSLKETQFATLNDIVPTILESIGLPIPENLAGVSLFKAHRNRRTFHNSRTGVYAVVERKKNAFYKLIYNQKTNEKLLYNLNNDLQEKNNLAEIQANKVLPLLKQLKIHFKLP